MKKRTERKKALQGRKRGSGKRPRREQQAFYSRCAQEGERQWFSGWEESRARGRVMASELISPPPPRTAWEKGGWQKEGKKRKAWLNTDLWTNNIGVSHLASALSSSAISLSIMSKLRTCVKAPLTGVCASSVGAILMRSSSLCSYEMLEFEKNPTESFCSGVTL